MSRTTAVGRRADAMRPVLDGRDVRLDVAAVAQVWQGAGRPWTEIAVPGVRLARGDALVEVELATICEHVLDTVAVPGHAAAGVVGHEQVGRVVDADEHAHAVDGSRLRPGMRVVWSTTVSCGRCTTCHRGLPQACVSLERYGDERMRRSWQLSGGLASHVHVRRGTAVVVVTDEVPATVLAPVPCAVATAAEALHRASSVGPLRGEAVIVWGAGAAGLVASAMAADAGARVVVCDPEEARRLGALDFGAVAVVDPAVPTGPLSLARALAAVDRSGRHRSVGIDFTGDAAALSTLVDVVAPGGVVVAAGTGAGHAGAVSVLPSRLSTGQLTLAGVDGAAPARLVFAAAWASEAWRRWPLESLVGSTVELDRVAEAVARASAPGAPCRVGVTGPAQEARRRR